jgi:PKD repeat protein
MNSTTGIISGTPTTTGVYSVTVNATNSVGTTSQSLSLAVNVANSTISRLSPPSALFSFGDSGAPYISRFLKGQRFDLQATVQPSTGLTVTSVDFQINGTSIGTITSSTGGRTSLVSSGLTGVSANSVSANYRAYSTAKVGVHTLTAVATLSNGATVTANGNFEVVNTPAAGTKAKNLIIMIGDGMGSSHRTAARIVKNGVYLGKSNAPLAMDQFPFTGVVSTASLNSIVTDSAPGAACKIQENIDQGAKRGDVASGFPFMPRFANYPKNVTMALIPIDFSDLEGDANFKSRVKQDMEYTSDWYRDVSEGQLTIEWKVSDNWIRLPGLSKDYFVEFSGKYPDTINFWNKVIPVVDSKFDLTGVQTINFLLPQNQKIIYESVQSFSFLSEMKQLNSSKTKILSFAAAGEVFQAPHTLWSFWAHEFGHEIGWAHVGSSRGDVEPMNGLELMGNQNGPYRDLSGWMRFIIQTRSGSDIALAFQQPHMQPLR